MIIGDQYDSRILPILTRDRGYSQPRGFRPICDKGDPVFNLNLAKVLLGMFVAVLTVMVGMAFSPQ